MARPVGRPARVLETRAAETRSNERREMPQAQHVGKLYVPRDEIPPGMTYSWIDVGQGTLMPEPNTIRAGEQSAKGWVPVPRARHPRFRNGGSLIPGFADSDPYSPYIKVGASLLCERPTPEIEIELQMKRAAASDQVRSISRWRSGEGGDPLLPRIDQSTAPEYDHRAAFKQD